MSKIDNVRRIVVEDFDKDYRDLISKLSFILNRFMDQTVLQLNGNIDIDNLKMEQKTFKTIVDASGNPKTSLKVKSVPDQTSGVIEIKNITGLTQDQEYELTVLIF
jgi:hypothetical protein